MTSQDSNPHPQPGHQPELLEAGRLWNYIPAKEPQVALLSAADFKVCPFCSANLGLLDSTSYGENEYASGTKNLYTCPTCGFWRFNESYNLVLGRGTSWGLLKGQGSRQTHGVLANLDLLDCTLPVGDLKAYLSIKPDRIRDLHPRQFELLVGSIFRDRGFDAEVTPYTKDKGIDVVLKRDDQTSVVQVKQTKNTVGIGQIHSFLGAMVMGGNTQGFFVSSNSFSGVAIEESAKLSRGEFKIGLIAGNELMEILGLKRRQTYLRLSELSHLFPTMAVDSNYQAFEGI